MKSFKSILFCPAIVICGLLLGACSAHTEAVSSPAAQTDAPTAVPQGAASPAPASTQADGATPEPGAAAALDGEGMEQKTRDFILVGQKDRPEAGQYHWAEEFLDLLDLGSLYKEYIAQGGKAGDVEGFTAYITENAPVPDHWKDMFEAAFAEAYGEKIVQYELIQDTYYQVYVELDGSAVPYVAVNARTGYYHG
ncbi:MAG: hypothetical protein AAGU74_05200 [Bacillota bacterium]